LKKIFSLLLILVLAFGLVGCSSSDDDDATIESLNLDTTSAIVKVGSEFKLPTTATALMSDGASKEVALTWNKEVDTSTAGVYTFAGSTEDTDTTVTFELDVRETVDVDVDLPTEFPTAPEAPTGFSATAIDYGVELTWDNTASKYLIYYGASEDDRSPLFETAISGNSYTDDELFAGDTYYYWIRAIDADGLNSDFAGPIKATTTGFPGVIVHFKYTEPETPWMYAWDLDGEAGNYQGAGWPGAPLTAEGNDWYGAELEGYRSIGLLFTLEDGTKLTKNGQDESRDQGEWWYMDGDWYDYNPEG